MLAEAHASSVYTMELSSAASGDLHCVPAQADHTYLQLKKDLDYLDLKVRRLPPGGQCLQLHLTHKGSDNLVF